MGYENYLQIPVMSKAIIPMEADRIAPCNKHNYFHQVVGKAGPCVLSWLQL